jgi:succinate dehydrogenase hydrophobic anchor subunit
MPQSSSAPAPPATPKSGGGSGSMLIGLASWILFTVIAEHGTLKVASIAALVIAIGVCGYSMRGGKRPKLIELAAVATFIVFTVIAFVADPSLTHWLTRYARAVAAGVLALLVFGSLLFVPFTEEYAREMVPREYWHSEQFKQVNRKLTVVWGEIFLVMTVSHIIAGTVDKQATNIIFNWVIPIALVLWGTKQSTADKDTQPVLQQA